MTSSVSIDFSPGDLAQIFTEYADAISKGMKEVRFASMLNREVSM